MSDKQRPTTKLAVLQAVDLGRVIEPGVGEAQQQIRFVLVVHIDIGGDDAGAGRIQSASYRLCDCRYRGRQEAGAQQGPCGTGSPAHVST